MNNNDKKNLLKLKNYLLLVSMIGGVTILPGCAGQDANKQNNEQTVYLENTLELQLEDGVDLEVVSNTNDESTVLLVLDNGNYIIYDCDDYSTNAQQTVYIVDINGEKFALPNSKVVRPFQTDKYGKAHDKAVHYAETLLHIDSDGFGSNRIIDYDDIQKTYKKK